MTSQILVPKVTPNDDGAEVIEWLVPNGASVKKGQEVVEIGTSKSTLVIESIDEGFLYHVARKGDWFEVGSVIGEISSSQRSEVLEVAEQGNADKGSSRLSKAAAKIASSQSMALPNYRLITTKDLEAPASAKNLSAVERMIKTPPIGNLRFEKVDREKRNQILALEVGQEGNLNSSHTIQMLAQPLIDALTAAGKPLAQLSTTILSCIAKNIAEYPKASAFYYDGKIYFYERHCMGLAMQQQGRPLKVVGVPDADSLTIDDLHKKTFLLNLKYLKDDLEPKDLEGYTYTISMLLAENILFFQPLRNHFQSLIIGVGGDKNLAGYPITLTATFDHRVFEGIEIARLLNKIKSSFVSQIADIS